MKEVTFTGSLEEVYKQAAAWRAANPRARIIYAGGPTHIGNLDGQSIFDQDDWTLSMRYEDVS